jgi:2',3'-cyclic-nucleotide 2'-phosphodiesterase (5'-nucleotidase family)
MTRNAFVTFLFALSALHAQVTTDTPITILQTTDLHHHANGADHTGFDADKTTGMGATGAYARISAYVNYVRSSAGHSVVLVDSGDWTMGTLYDLTLSSSPVGLAFLDQMHYNCVTLGNHEFDYTPKGLAQMLTAAQTSFGFHTPIVASNMNLGGSTDLAPFVGSGKMVQTTRTEQLPNGLKVGYIGLMGSNAAADAPVSAPVTFSDFSANYASIQTLVDTLRNSGVNIVIVLSHSGTDATGNSGEDVALAQNVKGIDVIASGHTHTPLASAHAVKNGAWTTQIIDAGAFGTNVSRIDLTYHPSSNSSTLDSSSNVPMTTAGLAAVQPTLAPDPTMISLVGTADLQLNAALGPFFSQTFPDYSKTSLATGIYHPVGTTAQNMVYNGLDAVPGPNGLGDLAADGLRNIPNSLIAQTLAAAGGNPASVPGYDFTPFQASVIATGVLRGKLLAGTQLTFADIYNVAPLGFTADSTQTLAVGYPLISIYLELADLKKALAVQLLSQSGLTSGDDYLNISGLKYSLDPTASYQYFKYATAGAILQLALQNATGGSLSAFQALTAGALLPFDHGTSLLTAYAQDNPWAGALVKLNDPAPTADQIAANLVVLGEVANDALADARAGTNTLSALVSSKAVAAIDTVSAFATADGTNTGTVTDLTGSSRVRVAIDIFALLALGPVEAQLGTTITVYKSATGSSTLSASDTAGLLANRIMATPTSSSPQELKEWMALLTYLTSGLKGGITSAYSSTSNFTQFPTFGAAVQTRNASYPLAAIAQLSGTLAGLQGSAAACSSTAKPTVAAVTNASYGAALSAGGTIIVWGTGFSPDGGNSIRLTPTGAGSAVTLNISSGTYFWDLSQYQINANLGRATAPGQWTLTVQNSCGATSAGFQVTLQ